MTYEERLREYRDYVYEEELKVKEARFAALFSVINRKKGYENFDLEKMKECFLTSSKSEFLKQYPLAKELAFSEKTLKINWKPVLCGIMEQCYNLPESYIESSMQERIYLKTETFCDGLGVMFLEDKALKVSNSCVK